VAAQRTSTSRQPPLRQGDDEMITPFGGGRKRLREFRVQRGVAKVDLWASGRRAEMQGSEADADGRGIAAILLPPVWGPVQAVVGRPGPHGRSGSHGLLAAEQGGG
jgi:hypothetical protein